MDAARPSCSVVVPVRDDDRALQRCLDALERQTTPADQVIVVDNASSDGSATIARRHGATLLHESRIGIPAAAARGYDAARGDLILRLDADSVPPADWVSRVVDRFLGDPGIDALSGPGEFTAVPAALRSRLTGWYWRFYFDALAQRVGVEPLFGSNLALRSSAWNRVRTTVHREDAEVHDDLDLSIHLVRAGCRLEFDPSLCMPVSVRPLLHPFGMIHRAQRAAHTLALHADPPRSTWRWLLTDSTRGALPWPD